MAKVFFANQGSLQPATLEKFEKEEELVDLVEDHPKLLPAEEILGLEEDEIRDQPAFLVLKREAGVNAGSIDLLLVDQNAIPTVVEAKLGDNREIRRKVIGQGLEYIANLSIRQAKDIWEEARVYYAEKQKELSTVFQEFHPEGNEIAFLEKLDKSLRDGRIQLIILADKLPLETRRVIEFLNKHSELLIFGVEVQKTAVGKNSKIYIVDVVGPSEEERATKDGKESYPDCLMRVKNIVMQALGQGQTIWKFQPTYVTAKPKRELEFRVVPARPKDSTREEGYVGYYVRLRENQWEAGFWILPNEDTSYVQLKDKLYVVLQQHQHEINAELNNPEWKEYPLRRIIRNSYNWGCSKDELVTKLAPEISERLLRWIETLQPIIEPVLREFQDQR